MKLLISITLVITYHFSYSSIPSLESKSLEFDI